MLLVLSCPNKQRFEPFMCLDLVCLFILSMTLYLLVIVAVIKFCCVVPMPLCLACGLFWVNRSVLFESLQVQNPAKTINSSARVRTGKV